MVEKRDHGEKKLEQGFRKVIKRVGGDGKLSKCSEQRRNSGWEGSPKLRGH